MEPPILLRAKFLVPRVGPDHLPRPPLLERLERSRTKRQILLSAPPGYGKTTLLVDFAAVVQLPLAWYQLDSSDGDPAAFLTGLIESLRRGVSGAMAAIDGRELGSAALALLDGVVSASPQHILTVLINELTEALDHDAVSVLEDYHLIANPVVHALMDYLIENAPPSLHFAISTRSDPRLALTRLCARGQLAELRTSDLRFPDQEIETWLARSMPGLSKESVRALSLKTEGWVASLQLALTSLIGKDLPSAITVTVHAAAVFATLAM